jgi:hypothetical protein
VATKQDEKIPLLQVSMDSTLTMLNKPVKRGMLDKSELAEGMADGVEGFASAKTKTSETGDLEPSFHKAAKRVQEMWLHVVIQASVKVEDDYIVDELYGATRGSQ